MKKKDIFIISILSIFILAMLTLTIYYVVNNETLDPNKTNNSGTTNIPNNSEIENIPTVENNDVILPTEGNDNVIKTKVATSLRIINEYSTDFFTANKNLIIMFGSWCPHCNEELPEVIKILNYYKNNKDVNVIIVAHEYDSTISDLIKLVEQDYNFGNIEILVDLNRVIRGTLDPEANTVPISYVVNKKGTVLKNHSSMISLDIAKDMLK